MSFPCASHKGRREKGESEGSNVRTSFSKQRERESWQIKRKARPCSRLVATTVFIVPSITALSHSPQCFNYGNFFSPATNSAVRQCTVSLHSHHHHQMSILNFCPSADTAAAAAVKATLYKLIVTLTRRE